MAKKNLLVIIILVILILGIVALQGLSKKRAEGEACKVDKNCQEELKCVKNICSSGKIGSPCLSKVDCLTGFCVKNKCIALSEEPNREILKKYFSLLRLARATEMPTDRTPQIEETNVFEVGDTFCLEGEPLKDADMAFEIYNPYEEVAVEPKGPAKTQKEGYKFIGCTPLSSSLVAGKKYEYKVYVGDTLVAVLPFEVIEK